MLSDHGVFGDTRESLAGRFKSTIMKYHSSDKGISSVDMNEVVSLSYRAISVLRYYGI